MPRKFLLQWGQQKSQSSNQQIYHSRLMFHSFSNQALTLRTLRRLMICESCEGSSNVEFCNIFVDCETYLKKMNYSTFTSYASSPIESTVVWKQSKYCEIIYTVELGHREEWSHCAALFRRQLRQTKYLNESTRHLVPQRESQIEAWDLNLRIGISPEYSSEIAQFYHVQESLVDYDDPSSRRQKPGRLL